MSSAKFSSLKRALRLCLTVVREVGDLKRFRSRGDLIEYEIERDRDFMSRCILVLESL